MIGMPSTDPVGTDLPQPIRLDQQKYQEPDNGDDPCVDRKPDKPSRRRCADVTVVQFGEGHQGDLAKIGDA